MEKDNKKARDDARREYNDTVRVSLYAAFSIKDFTQLYFAVIGEIYTQKRSQVQETPRIPVTGKQLLDPQDSVDGPYREAEGCRVLRRTRLAEGRDERPSRRSRLGSRRRGGCRGMGVRRLPEDFPQ